MTSDPTVRATPSDDLSAYASLAADGDPRWAFGAGFDASPVGVDAGLPAGVDHADLAPYCLMLGDDALVFSHRLQQWCTHGPELEDEVAVANIGLDLLGQARFLLARAGQAGGGDRSEDDLAFFRDEPDFRNVRLAELGGGDFGDLIARLLVFSTWRLALFGRLASSRDPVLAAIAAKGVKELTYHRDYAARWAVRLGDGTRESHRRMQAGIDRAWPFLEELLRAHPIETRLAEAGVGVDPSTLRPEVTEVLDAVLAAATLVTPAAGPAAGVGGRTGRDGVHTEAMGLLLAELQGVARAHPGATW